MMAAMNKILIVDDEKAIRDCLSEMLSFMGFNLAVASSGDEALEERYVMERMKESCVDYALFKPFALWEIQKTLKTLLEGDGGSILNE
jgi:PleD family two-component response regulator